MVLIKSRYGLEVRSVASGDGPGLEMLLREAGFEAAGVNAFVESFGHEAGVALIAVEWGPPSGVVVLHWHRTIVEKGLVARISFLLVGEEHRRRGIGRLLLKAAAHAARVAGCGRLEIEAPAEMASLRGFCEAAGFSSGGVLYSRGLRKKGQDVR